MRLTVTTLVETGAFHDGGLIDKLGEGIAVDLGHRTFDIVAAGIHGQHDIEFIQAGECHKGIGIIQALLGQQMHIGGIPVDNQSGGDCLAEINTALFIPVHHAHTHLHLAQLLRQKAGDAPGPDHHDIAGMVPENAQRPGRSSPVPGAWR